MNDALSSDRMTLRSLIEHEIERDGPMAFSRFMHHALYDPDRGFYSVGGQAGRRNGDFITSVEVGPLFGAVIASVLDERWNALGQPGVFRVAEVGAGVGTLYRTVYRANPACLGALGWQLVEQSANLRAAHDALPGDAWASSPELPPERQHLIVGNELLDNLPFDIVEKRPSGWAPVHVIRGLEERVGFEFSTADVDRSLDYLSTMSPHAPNGAQIPHMAIARSWVEQARSRADEVLLFDYAATTAELVDRDRIGWLRVYQGQQRGTDPLNNPGAQDITSDVAWDQLGPDITVSSQAAWLRRAGIDELVERARDTWRERAAIGDLAALIARSAINEAEALLDPDGLGGFRVLAWPGTSAG